MDNSDGEDQIHPSQIKSSGKESKRSPPYALFNLLVIIVAIIYGVYYQLYIKDADNETNAVVEESEDMVKIPMYTADELKKYNGEGEFYEKSLSMIKIISGIFLIIRYV